MKNQKYANLQPNDILFAGNRIMLIISNVLYSKEAHNSQRTWVTCTYLVNSTINTMSWLWNEKFNLGSNSFIVRNGVRL